MFSDMLVVLKIARNSNAVPFRVWLGLLPGRPFVEEAIFQIEPDHAKFKGFLSTLGCASHDAEALHQKVITNKNSAVVEHCVHNVPIFLYSEVAKYAL